MIGLSSLKVNCYIWFTLWIGKKIKGKAKKYKTRNGHKRSTFLEKNYLNDRKSYICIDQFIFLNHLMWTIQLFFRSCILPHIIRWKYYLSKLSRFFSLNIYIWSFFPVDYQTRWFHIVNLACIWIKFLIMRCLSQLRPRYLSEQASQNKAHSLFSR